MEPNYVKDTIEGIIYGGAIGDALGLATEFMNYSEIEKYYKNINIFTYNDIIQDYHRSTWQVGDWTDDTDHVIIIMKSIINKKSIDINDYAEKLVALINNGLPECDDKKGHGIGNTFSIWWGDKYCIDDPLRAGIRAYIYNPLYVMSNQSNGGIMKTAIIGTYNYNDFDKVVENTIKVCAMTHPSPLCVYSCIVVNYIITNLIKSNNRTHKFIFDLILKIIPDTKDYIINYIKEFQEKIIKINNENNEEDIMLNEIKKNISKNYQKVINNNIIDYVLYNTELTLYYNDIKMCKLQENPGFTLNPLKCVFYSIRKALEGQSYEQIISSIIREGGDADTNCAVTGSVLGAFFGKSKLPLKYINELKYKDVLDKYVCEYELELGLI